MSKKSNYLEYFINPFNLLRTQKVLHVNPTVLLKKEEEVNPEISVFEYDSANYDYKNLSNVHETFPLKDSQLNSWVNIDGLNKEAVEEICDHFEIHPLIAEDILSLDQRAKMDEINGVLYCVLHMIYYNDLQHTIETEQVSIVLGKRYVISFQEDASRDLFQQVRNKLQIDYSKIRQAGSDFLFYSLIDMIVDNYFKVMEKVADRIEDLEEDIIQHQNTQSLARINMLRKDLILFKRSIAPVRELVNGVLNSESDLIEERTEKYFKDIYDHIVQANDLSDNYRDMMMTLQDLYLSNVNLKMNEVMKVMAVVTCLLAPATVIGGIFGMNFDKIPLLHNQWGFFTAVAIMLIIPLVMLVIFRRRGWF